MGPSTFGLLLFALAPSPPPQGPQEEAGPRVHKEAIVFQEDGFGFAEDEQEGERADEPVHYTLEAADKLMTGHDYDGAAEILRGLVADDPDHAWAWWMLGYCYHVTDRLEEALVTDLRAAEFEETKAVGYYNAACACALMGRTDEAFRWLQASQDAGYHNPELFATDRDLDNLRKDKRFSRFLSVDVPVAHPFGPGVRVLHDLYGEGPGDQFGWVGRDAGDLDGDGYRDLLITAPYFKVDGVHAGKVYVYSGHTGEELFSFVGERGENLGMSAERAGDVNGDGKSDLIIGATEGGEGPGRAYVFSGADGKILRVLHGEAPGDRFGWKVTGAGDMNDDGRADLLVGAPGNDGAGTDAGRAYLFSGADGALIRSFDGAEKGDAFGGSVAASRCCEKVLAFGAGNAGPRDQGAVYVHRWVQSCSSTYEFTIQSDARGKNLGRMYLSVLGDVDGDGFPDIYASDWESEARGRMTGLIRVHSGATGEQLHVLTGEGAGDGFGTGPAHAGDVDGDGHQDLIVGAWKNSEGGNSAGKVYLYSGNDGSLLHTITCTAPETTFGFDANGIGDLDGDGGIDFLITAAWSAGCGARSGRAFVIAGPRPKEYGATPKAALVKER